MIDATAFGAELASIVKAATAPLLARIDALERAADVSPEPGRDGKDADPDAVAALVYDRVKADLEAIKATVDGIPEAPELPDIPAMVAEAVAKSVKDVPAPKDGKDGASVTADDMAPLIRDEVAKAVSAIPAAKDGVGLAGALIDRDGHLVVTLTNGDTKALGAVVGGKGADGLGFDDLTVEYDGERRLSLVFAKGEDERAFSFDLPMMIDRGVFVDGKQYATGDTVTFGGSIWVAQKTQPDGKPGLSQDWRLAVKKGRTAKEA